MLTFILLIFLALVLLRLFILRKASYYAEKMANELKALEWRTLKDLVEMGYPEFFCMMILPRLKRKGMLDIRLGKDVPAEALELIEKQGFRAWSVQFHEYRFKPDGTGGKKQKLIFPAFKDWGWGEPVHA